MSTIEEALRTILINDANVSSLVATRVYPQVLPESPTLPAITYQTVLGGEISANDGGLGLHRIRVQIDVLDDSFTDLKTLVNHVKEALVAYKGTSATVTLVIPMVLSEVDLYDYELDLRKVVLDFRVLYNS